MYTNVEMIARACARYSVAEGATAPWPKGCPLQRGDVEFLRANLRAEPTRDELRAFGRAFEAAIDEMAPERE